MTNVVYLVNDAVSLGDAIGFAGAAFGGAVGSWLTYILTNFSEEQKRVRNFRAYVLSERERMQDLHTSRPRDWFETFLAQSESIRASILERSVVIGDDISPHYRKSFEQARNKYKVSNATLLRTIGLRTIVQGGVSEDGGSPPTNVDDAFADWMNNITTLVDCAREREAFEDARRKWLGATDCDCGK